jgi:hypothetical protein
MKKTQKKKKKKTKTNDDQDGTEKKIDIQGLYTHTDIYRVCAEA